MFNNPLFHEEVRLKVRQREQEAEMYRWQKQLGYSDRRAARRVVLLVMLLPALVILLLL
jgi:hypothetical protein